MGTAVAPVDEPPGTPGTAGGPVDERLTGRSAVRSLLARPEIGAVIAAVAVYAFFAWQSEVFASVHGAANFLDPASTLGIMAVPVGLLMIGGEFDLSAGVMTTSAGLITALLVVEADWNIWLAMLISLLFALVVGALNGVLVIRTGLPSFIVTLGTLLILQGANLGYTKQITDTVQVPGVDDADGYDSARQVLASVWEFPGWTVDLDDWTLGLLGWTWRFGGGDLRISILWWMGLTALATWMLLRTRPGNWIFAVGGDAQAARNVGVPAARTKVALFMTTSAAACLLGNMTAIRLRSVQADTGVGEEFQYIIAAVIGGCLLRGGYGSAIGAALGARIFGMTRQGIVFAGWNSDWFQLFLGMMLLLAALLNRLVRTRAEEAHA